MHVHVLCNIITVEPRLSGPPLSGTLIIWLGIFFLNNSENGRVPEMRMRIVTVTMETGLLIRRQPCGTAVYEWIKAWFIYLIIHYPACLWNQGVRIIEALLYIRTVPTCTSVRFLRVVLKASCTYHTVYYYALTGVRDLVCFP